MSKEQKEGFTRQKLDEIIENGAGIIGSVSSTALGFLVAGPVGGFVGAAVSSPITSILKRLGSEVSDQIMAPREKTRVSATYLKSAIMIKERLDAGEEPRKDGFFDFKDNDRPSAETVLEGMLQKAKNEHEEKKLEYYSAFLTNITFDDSIDFQKSITLIKIIDRLSYQQLCILSYISDLNQINFENWGKLFQDEEKAQTHLDFYFEIAELFELSLLKQFNGKLLGGFKNGELTQIGSKLFQLMNLNQIPETDKNLVENKINLIENL
ncbi:hypothetical protein QO200_12750 [Flavobacterium sp. Arc3]|uniref:hypothetical protein n=1 Tax=Flavobacterium sp. Arc3 TaxID=3046686 RepID=UPI00352EBFFB